MQRNCFILILMLNAFVVSAQPNSSAKQSNNVTNPNARFVGKYELEGLVIQFALQKEVLVLIVPGAPIQELKSIGKNKFKSASYKDGLYTFTDDGEKVTGVTIDEKRGTSKGKKIAGNVTLSSIAMDSLLVLKKSTEHFSFRYSAIDSDSIDSIANDMEKNYKRILDDFKLKTVLHVTVRIYPDLQSFHKGINLPNGPDQVLATAFGKDDIRMVSPNNAGPESWMLAYAAPHEFTHVVHLNIDYSPNNPTWLWEGVAQYEARWFFDPRELDIIRKKEFPSLNALNNGMEYMLGYTIIEAIKDRWGFDTVIQLIKNQGDVKKVLKIDEKEFENEIFEHIYQKYIQH